MKLRDIIRRTNNNTRIRIFVGCQTIFNESKSGTSEKEYNIVVRPYLDCPIRSVNYSIDSVIVII